MEEEVTAETAVVPEMKTLLQVFHGWREDVNDSYPGKGRALVQVIYGAISQGWHDLNVFDPFEKS